MPQTQTKEAKNAAYEKGRRGRKPGHGKVPGSGLKKGQKVITADLKQEILVKGKPLDLLCNVSRGLKIRVGPQAGPDAKYVYPSLKERLDAARTLLAKVLPDMKATELSGPDGSPIQQQTQILEASARVSAVFSDAKDAEDVAERLPDDALHTIQAVNFLHAKQQAQTSRGAPALTRPTNGAAKPEAAVAPPEPIVEAVPEAPAEPEPPEPGFTVAFVTSELSITGCPPDREGLPNVYELKRRGMLMRRAAWPVILDLAKQQSGGDLGAFIVQEPRPQAGQHFASSQDYRRH